MAQVKDFKLPDLGEGLTEGTIIAWRVEVGDTIELNATIAEIETAKAVVEVPSPYAGTIVERHGDEGEELEVGTVIVRIEVTGGVTHDEPEAAAASSGLDAAEAPKLVGYGAKDDAPRRAAAPQSGQRVEREGRPLAKPPVRKLAKDLGVDLAHVAGSGDGGIITREDVRAFADGGSTSAAAPSAAPVASAPEASTAPARVAVPTGGGGGEKFVPGFRDQRPGTVIPIAGIKKRIVEKMEQSRREIPEATCSYTADVTELWELRKRLTVAAEQDGFAVKITPFALMLRAVILALRRFPTLNANIDREAGEIRLLEHINLGFAADTDRGLVVPNIKNAESLTLLQIASELNRMAASARDGKIAPADLMGGTFTVSNYGAFGNDTGNPIINHPEGAILGIGSIAERPWVVDGEIAVRRTCTFSLAFDHRISDGGEAGRFTTYVGELCADPARILLHG